MGLSCAASKRLLLRPSIAFSAFFLPSLTT